MFETLDLIVVDSVDDGVPIFHSCLGEHMRGVLARQPHEL